VLLLASAAALAQSGVVYQAPWAQVGATVSLSASNSSSRVALGWTAVRPTPPPTNLWLHNGGLVDAYVVAGDSAVVATTGGVLVAAGGDAMIALNGATHLAGITASGSTTLSMAAGVGSPLAKGGGGGGSATNLTVGTTAITSGTDKGLLYDNAGVLGNLATGNSGVLVTGGTGVPSISTTLPSGLAAANMVLTTPNLGTPSAATLTSATGLPVDTGISGLGAGVATFLGTPSSTNLRGALTDESGTGAAYFQGGDLGTPSAGVLTNATGLPCATGITNKGWCLISTLTANNTATTLQFSSLPTYNNYVLVLDAILPATNSVSITFTFGEAGVSKTSGYHTTFLSTSSATTTTTNTNSEANSFCANFNAVTNTTSHGGVNGEYTMKNLQSTTQAKSASYVQTFYNGTSVFRHLGSCTYTADTNAITDLFITSSSGNLASGKAMLYGYD
jgi:hypothetical protein